MVTDEVVETTARAAGRLIDNIASVVLGKRPQIEYLVAALLCRGHVLIEDVPGTGKTVLARATAASLDLEFRRIQCTPDLLPSDITGVRVYRQHEGTFEFQPGPVFTNVLLADEINRATPRTQSALLQAMEERAVTVEGSAHALPRPFLVLATQNPVEFEGTFPLPEAQLDRFLIRMSLGYPEEGDEIALVHAQAWGGYSRDGVPRGGAPRGDVPYGGLEADEDSRIVTGHPVETLAPVMAADELWVLSDMVPGIYMHPELERYLLAIVRATRSHKEVSLGASPRGTLGLYRTAQALAALRSREFVSPDDIKEMAPLVLAHRLLLRPESVMRERTGEAVVGEILEVVSC